MKAKDRKFITVSTRLTKKQADEFKECARKRNMTTAQFLRMLAEQRLNELRTTKGREASCVLNELSTCIAVVPEACVCNQMADDVYERQRLNIAKEQLKIWDLYTKDDPNRGDSEPGETTR